MDRSIRALGISVALVLAASPAAAQDRASAEELFRLGKAAMAQKDVLRACNYFQASLKSDFALGTLLNLAICHEQAGRVASAWSEYRVLEDKARRVTPPQNDRAQFAHDRAEALRPRLSRVRIRLPPEDRAMPGFTVKIDDTVAQPELFDAGVPVDMGRRTITASAPDHEPWTRIVAIDDEKITIDVSVPTLDHSAAPPPPPPAKPDKEAIARVERDATARSQRKLGFTVAGIGLGVVAAGGVFGVLAATTKKNTTCGACIEGSPQLTDAQGSYARANAFAWVSNIALAAGTVGVAVGAYFVFTAHPDAPSITAGVGPGGFALGGTL